MQPETEIGLRGAPFWHDQETDVGSGRIIISTWF